MKSVLIFIWKFLSQFKTYTRELVYGKNWIQEVPAITVAVGPYTGKKLGHIASYTMENAGDILLPRTVRDVVGFENDVIWKGMAVHKKVDFSSLQAINELDGLLIGGGGLFLRDTNPNQLSGWQWSCDVETLNRIQIPIALFAVGYNRFRGQPDFDPIFKRHLLLLTKKSVFIGLRNSGSMEAVKSYLPESLHHKIRFQPCPTTLCQRLYPEVCQSARESIDHPFIVLNCAFDRIDLRMGERKEEILTSLCIAMRELAKSFPIKFYSHAPGDEEILPYMDRVGVPYDFVSLRNSQPRDVVQAYSKPALVIGMRGHAQMIPFGCGVPIISLISHDKLKWFLDDIEKPDWGVEMLSSNFSNDLVALAFQVLRESKQVTEDIKLIQNKYWTITERNVADFLSEIR